MLWKLHPITHKDTIAVKSDVLSIELQLNKRFVNFDEKCKRKNNSVVRCIVQVSKKNPMSPFGKNIRKCVQVDVMYKDWFSRRDIINDDVNVIRELLEICENLKSVNVLNDYDVDFIIESLCINLFLCINDMIIVFTIIYIMCE